MRKNKMKRKTLFALSCFVFVIGFFVSVTGKLSTKSKDLSNSDQGKSVRKMYKLAEMMDEVKGSAALSRKEYHELVFSVPRNYTVFVLFHNDPHICQGCLQTLENFKRIAKSYWRGFTTYDETTSSRHLQFPLFFATVTMSSVGSRKFLVDLDPSVPNLYVFTPSLSSKYNQFEQAERHLLEFGRYNLPNMLGWVQDKAGFIIPIEKEERSNGALTLITLAFCGVLTLINMHYFGLLDVIREALSQANYTYGISVVLLWLLSGQMFNYIRNTAFFGSNGFGPASLIYPGTRSQYGMESIIIMLVYALMVYSFMSLLETRERQLEEHLPNSEVQHSIQCALSGLFFGFLALQMISNVKTGR